MYCENWGDRVASFDIGFQTCFLLIISYQFRRNFQMNWHEEIIVIWSRYDVFVGICYEISWLVTSHVRVTDVLGRSQRLESVDCISQPQSANNGEPVQNSQHISIFDALLDNLEQHMRSHLKAKSISFQMRPNMMFLKPKTRNPLF